ncbi:MAG: hypothetical protein ACP5T2_00030 [Thermoprotei archaeon]
MARQAFSGLSSPKAYAAATPGARTNEVQTPIRSGAKGLEYG